MEKFTIYYEESGQYTTKTSVEVEAETREKAIEIVETMKEAGKLRGLTPHYEYERADTEIF